MIAPEVKPVDTYKPDTKDPKNPIKPQNTAKKPAAILFNNRIAKDKEVKKVGKAYYSSKLTA